MGKRKCTLYPELQKEFPFLEKRAHKGNTIGGVYCKLCQKTFSIANGGRYDIERHARLRRHREREVAHHFSTTDNIKIEPENRDDDHDNNSDISFGDSASPPPEEPQSPPPPNSDDDDLLEGHLLCALCSHPFPTQPPNKIVDKFLHHLELDDNDNRDKFPLCASCLSSVIRATARREQAEQVEVVVRSLQQEILRMLGDLKGLMGGYLDEMTNLNSKIRRGNKGILQTAIGKVVQDLGGEIKAPKVTRVTVKVEPGFNDSDEGSDDNQSLDNEMPKQGHNFKRYLCTQCHRTYKSKYYLQTHYQKIHDNKAIFKCRTCQKVFHQIKQFRQHLTLHKSMGFICELCGARRDTPAALRIHRKTHDKARIDCGKCSASFVNKKFWERHQKLHEDGRKEYRCEKCDKVFQSNKYLKSHMNVHEDKKAYRCENCGMGFFFVTSLWKHRRRVHGIQSQTGNSAPQEENSAAAAPENVNVPAAIPQPEVYY